MIEWIKDKLEDERYRKFIVMGSIILIVLVVLNLGEDKEPIDWKERAEANKSESVLGVSEGANAIQANDIDGIVRSLRKQIETSEAAMAKQDEAREIELQKLQADLQANKAEIYEYQRQLKAIFQATGRPINAQDASEQKGGNRQVTVEGEPLPLEQNPLQPQVVYRQPTQIVTPEPLSFDNDVIRTITQRRITEVKENGKIEVRQADNLTLSGNTIEMSGVGTDAPEESTNPRVNDTDKGEFTLAMGSIISGTLLNGVAAPTGVNSSSSPMPVLMRIKREALMPNAFTLDIRECHMIGEAVGSLADERVQIRAVGISCITEDGQAIEKSLTAYAVSSSDGMAGIRGEVVSRSKKMILNTMIAGGFSGFADAAAPNQVSSINTSPTVDALWQSQNLDSYAGAGIMQGASNSLSKLADYYMSMVEQMFPVIELIPGLQVDFIVQRGMTLNLDPNNRQGTQTNSPVSSGE